MGRRRSQYDEQEKEGGRVSLLLDGLFGLTLSAEPKRDVDLVLFINVATL